MNSDAGKGRADSSERDAVWESENPFGGQKQDSATPNSGSSRSLASPAITSGNWRRPTPELLSDPTSAAHDDLSSNSNSARPPRSTSRLNPTRQQAHSALGPRQQRTPLSTAAASRTHVHNSHRKPFSSYMKQSCLPVDERDPVLELAEQHKGASLQKRTRTDSLFGPVFTKMRKMIVVALYHDHYTALPLYTHNGNGLQAKAKPDEFVSVKDHRMQGPFTQLSKHLALVTEVMNPGTTLMHPKATAHLTHPVSRKYDLPVTPVGQLDKSSTRSVIALYLDTIPRPPKL